MEIVQASDTHLNVDWKACFSFLAVDKAVGYGTVYIPYRLAPSLV